MNNICFARGEVLCGRVLPEWVLPQAYVPRIIVKSDKLSRLVPSIRSLPIGRQSVEGILFAAVRRNPGISIHRSSFSEIHQSLHLHLAENHSANTETDLIRYSRNEFTARGNANHVWS